MLLLKAGLSTDRQTILSVGVNGFLGSSIL